MLLLIVPVEEQSIGAVRLEVNHKLDVVEYVAGCRQRHESLAIEFGDANCRRCRSRS